MRVPPRSVTHQKKNNIKKSTAKMHLANYIQIYLAGKLTAEPFNKIKGFDLRSCRRWVFVERVSQHCHNPNTRRTVRTRLYKEYKLDLSCFCEDRDDSELSDIKIWLIKLTHTIPERGLFIITLSIWKLLWFIKQVLYYG